MGVPWTPTCPPSASTCAACKAQRASRPWWPPCPRPSTGHPPACTPHGCLWRKQACAEEISSATEPCRQPTANSQQPMANGKRQTANSKQADFAIKKGASSAVCACARGTFDPKFGFATKALSASCAAVHSAQNRSASPVAGPGSACTHPGHWQFCSKIAVSPFAICHLPFAICHLPFAICHFTLIPPCTACALQHMCLQCTAP